MLRCRLALECRRSSFHQPDVPDEPGRTGQEDSPPCCKRLESRCSSRPTAIAKDTGAKDGLWFLADEMNVDFDGADPAQDAKSDLRLVGAAVDDLSIMNGDILSWMRDQQFRQQSVECAFLPIELARENFRQTDFEFGGKCGFAHHTAHQDVQIPQIILLHRSTLQTGVRRAPAKRLTSSRALESCEKSPAPGCRESSGSLPALRPPCRRARSRSRLPPSRRSCRRDRCRA
jgi:hypothetical protein